MIGLVDALKHLFRKRRSSKEQEKLTQDEVDKIEESMDDGGHARCPDCWGFLTAGPKADGGFILNVNVACQECGSEFNLAIDRYDELVGGERISDRGPRTIEPKRKVLYARAG